MKNTNVRMTRRHFLGGALASTALLGLSGCRFQSGQGAATDTISVGVIMPLSGGSAQSGINSRDGIQMIVDGINNSGGIESLNGANIELSIADSTAEPSTAATTAQRFISQNSVVGVLGAFSSSLTVAVSDVTERQGIPLLTNSYTDELTERGYEYVFRIPPKATVIGRATFDYALEIGEAAGGQAVERVAIMYEDTAYGTSQAEGLRDSAEDAGITVVMDEAFPFGITDVSPLVSSLRGSDAQLVFPVAGAADDAIKIVGGIQRQGLETLVVGGSGGYVIPDFVDGLGELAEGVLSINTSNWDLAPDVTQEFQDQFGYFMVHEAIEYAAGMLVLAEALETSGSTETADIREAIIANAVSGNIADAMPGGRIEFDDTGQNTVAFPIMNQWQDGELVTVYPENVATSRPYWPGVG
jgi:branched-chain amino acid transport system substrate-binding protein